MGEEPEFSGFSQHGEDGIIDYLCRHLLHENLFFFEIGAADGLENCTSWLAFVRGYGGVMVEGDPELSARCRLLMNNRIWNVHVVNLFVEENNVAGLLRKCPYKDPDVFALDIDGIDYYIAREVFESGFKPKIFLVEYNSAFGPDQAITVPYSPRFNRWDGHPSGLYYGVSIAGWKNLFRSNGYEFLTVERSGTNAIFIDRSAFPEGFTDGLKRSGFRENIGDGSTTIRPYVDSYGDEVLPLRNWGQQFENISNLKFIVI